PASSRSRTAPPPSASNLAASRLARKRGITPALFHCPCRQCERARLAIVALRGPVLEAFQMVLAQSSNARRRVVIDDRSRLPGRFFGRFATSATSELTRAL